MISAGGRAGAPSKTLTLGTPASHPSSGRPSLVRASAEVTRQLIFTELIIRRLRFAEFIIRRLRLAELK